MIDRRKVIICLFLFSIPFICNYLPIKAEGFHTKEEIAQFQSLDAQILTGDSLFLTSASCKQCHGFDTAMIASVTPGGEDVNLFDDWKVSMMANSAKDPFWRAKVSHEVLVNSTHQNEIENKCTSCHAPLGHYNALLNQEPHYTIANMLSDTLGLDGVSCLACHQQTDFELGFTHSGTLHFDSVKNAYGPFESPLESPMLSATQFRPVYSEHIRDAGVCAGCHTLITETSDLNGEPTGTTFVEQATYHEWLNSRFNVENITCQECHMPGLKGQFFLIAGLETELRSPFYKHEIVGGNSFMMELMKDNRVALEIDATEEEFDEAIAATLFQLRNKTLEMEFEVLERTADTTYFQLDLINEAGHKFPSGYPARRAFVSFVVENVDGDTLFHSGKLDDTFEVFGQDNQFEPHHQTIVSEDQVQIYEMVMADVNGNFTTLLDRGHHLLKDNRLVPEGFSMSHSTYDTTKLEGQVLVDPDFNMADNVEGSGSDRIYFNIPMNGYNDLLHVKATVLYQSAPPKWMAEMFAETTPEIEEFRTMFDGADKTPVLIKEKTLEVELFKVGISEQLAQSEFVKLHRISNKEISIDAEEAHEFIIYDTNGRLISKGNRFAGDYVLELPNSVGMYFIRFLNKNGGVQMEKVLRF